MSVELKVAREINNLQTLDLDALSKVLRQLPMPTKFVSRMDIPAYYHVCSEQELLDALFGIFERFPWEEDFGLWSAVTNAIELFEESRVRDGIIHSLQRQPMWKTAELATQYCTRGQIKELVRHCQDIRSRSEKDIQSNFEHIIGILQDVLEG